ncbi:MAG: septum formation protein Maf [Lachnospiraceae bacterium]|nr:septum formation protein Maf [Lachnospiraceae bacterium]
MDNKNKKIILASASPRRKELLKQAGYDFDVIVSNVEEVITKSLPWEVVEELAYQKAKDVFRRLLSEIDYSFINEDDYTLTVIGADTVVSVDDKILGKPADKNEAYEMIHSLQNKTHQVYTGIAILDYNFSTRKTVEKYFYEKTDVTLFPMTSEEIYDYIDTGDCYDKAGAYGIQGQFAIFVREIQGDYNNVVGLPIARLYQELKKIH